MHILALTTTDMFSIRFQLRDPKADVTPLRIVIRNARAWKPDKLPFVYPSGENVEPRIWNQNKQQVGRSGTSVEFNNKLSNLKTFIQNEIRTYEIANGMRPPSKEQLRKLLDDKLHPSLVSGEMTLMRFLNQFIKENETRINPRSGKPISETTKKEYKRLRSLLREYYTGIDEPEPENTDPEKYYAPHGPQFEDIDLEWYIDFLRFLQEEKMYMTNTIGLRISKLKTFLEEATERGYNRKTSYKSKKFAAVFQETTQVYLDLDELAEWAALDLSHSERLENACDFYLIGNWTCMRHQSYSKFNLSKVNKGVIEYTANKTSQAVTLPVLPELVAILNKWKHRSPTGLPRPLGYTQINAYVKEIGKMMPSMHKLVEVQYTKAGKHIIKQVPKYTLLGSHTARRSFATNALKMGVPEQTVMVIGGWRSRKSLHKYNKMSGAEHAEILRNIWNENSKMKVV